jgi:hypothetical protein
MLRAMLAAALVCASVTATAAAASPTDEEVAACTSDAKLFCKPQFKGLLVDLRVHWCSGSHRRELSPKREAVFRQR